MIPQKFYHSRETINTDRISQQQSFYKSHKNLAQVVINPYPAKPLLKFPKNKAVRRQTQMNTLIQTSNNPQKLCIKPFQIANKTTMNDAKQIKRIAKFGKFNPMSKSLDNKHPEPRTFQDIGIHGNKKKTPYPSQFKQDPIIVGETPSKISKCSSVVWTQQRRVRDNGQIAKQQLVWKVNPQIKRSFYGKDQKIKEKPDYATVLNYHRKK